MQLWTQDCKRNDYKKIFLPEVVWESKAFNWNSQKQGLPYFIIWAGEWKTTNYKLSKYYTACLGLGW